MIEGDFGGPGPWTARNGEPVSREKPHGAVVVVYRRSGADIELLVLHRAVNGATYEGDWAWGPPSGLRRPGEDPTACAARELLEETGLSLTLHEVDPGDDAFAICSAEASPDAVITLSDEHDRFEWVDVTDALTRCRPEVAADEIAHALAVIAPVAAPE